MTNSDSLQKDNTPRSKTDDDEIDLFGLLGALLDHKWLIIGVTVAFAIVGVLYTTLATPIYRADALVQVERKAGGIPAFSDVGEMFGAEPKASTEIELIRSRSVIGKAVENLRLDIHVQPVRMPLVGEWLARGYQPSEANKAAPARFGFSSYAWGGESLELFRFDLPPHRIGQTLELHVEEGGGYSVVDGEEQLLLQGRVGEPAAANGIHLHVSEMVARPGTRFELRRVSTLSAVRAQQAALEVAERGRDTGMLTLALEHRDSEQARQIVDEIAHQFVRQNVDRMSAEAANSLEFLRGQLPKVRQDLEKAEGELNSFQSLTSSVDISYETQNVLNQIVSIESEISRLKLQQAEFDRRLTRQHPHYQALLTQLDELERQKNTLSNKVQDLPETQQELLRYARDVEVSTQIYTQMLNRAQELEVARAGTVGNVRIIDTAVTSLGPVKPQKSLIVLIAAVMGAVGAIGFVLVRRAFNRGIETPDEIEQLGLPVYATVPLSLEQKRLGESRWRAGKSGAPAVLLARSRPDDLAIESLRSLRTSLHFAMLEAPDNRLMLCGPSPSVGKTFVAANLAGVIAQSGQRVLVIDADMRKGKLHKLFGDSAEKGLSDVLVKTCSLDQAIRKAKDVEGLYYMTRGSIPPNPSELLMHANFTALLDEVGQGFDLVMLDTPPLLAVTDAAIIGRQVGTSLIVTRFGMNPAREVELTVRRFGHNGVTIKGAIFNGVEKRAATYGGYHYYQYDYKSDKS